MKQDIYGRNILIFEDGKAGKCNEELEILV
jgi:hypothetical protein